MWSKISYSSPTVEICGFCYNSTEICPSVRKIRKGSITKDYCSTRSSPMLRNTISIIAVMKEPGSISCPLSFTTSSTNIGWDWPSVNLKAWFSSKKNSWNIHQSYPIYFGRSIKAILLKSTCSAQADLSSSSAIHQCTKKQRLRNQLRESNLRLRHRCESEWRWLWWSWILTTRRRKRCWQDTLTF